MTKVSYVLWEEEGGYVIRALEIPVTTQGDTKEEAVSSLGEAVSLYLEDQPADMWDVEVKGVETGNILVHA